MTRCLHTCTDSRHLPILSACAGRPRAPASSTGAHLTINRPGHLEAHLSSTNLPGVASIQNSMPAHEANLKGRAEVAWSSHRQRRRWTARSRSAARAAGRRPRPVCGAGTPRSSDRPPPAGPCKETHHPMCGMAYDELSLGRAAEPNIRPDVVQVGCCCQVFKDSCKLLSL